MKSTHVKNISLRRNVLPVVFDMVQLDTGNVIAFHVRDVTIPGGTTAKAFFVKPSGKIVYKDSGITVSGQQITLPVDNQAIAESGITRAQINLYNGTDTLSSFTFTINVFHSLKDMLMEQSENVIGAFDQAVADAIAEVGAVIDPTLTQANKAGEAKATGDGLKNVKEYLKSLAEDGLQLLSLGWVNGLETLPSDSPFTSKNKYRVYCTVPLVGNSFTFHIADGFRLYIWQKHEDGTFGNLGWKTGEFTCAGNYGLYLSIARVTEDTTEVASPDEFSSKVKIKSLYLKALESEIQEITEIASGSHKAVSIVTGGDLDEITDAGWYVIGYSSVVNNCPIDSGVRYMVVINYGTTLRMQLLYGMRNGECYVREYRNGAWMQWHKLNESEEVGNTTVLSYERKAFTASASNDGEKVRIMSYNIAQYNNDTTTKITDEKLVNLKKLVANIGADFMGLQEDSQYIDANRTQDGHDYIWKPLYPVKHGVGTQTTIYSKRAIAGSGTGQTSSGRWIQWAKALIGEKTLLFVNFHATAGDTEQQTRADEYSELFSFVSGIEHDYCIITGDFNSKTDTDHETLASECQRNGFTMANGGWLGWIKTHKNGVSLDNILCGPGCIINNIVAYENEYGNLYSDHIPFVADVTLN